MADKSIVIFGAGKIGRSFIGQLFGRNGYKILFVDKDRPLIKALNERGAYSIVFKDPETVRRMSIGNVSAIEIAETAEVQEAIRETDIMAVSVGKASLPDIAPAIAHGLIDREKKYPGKVLDVILAENMRSTDQYFRDLLRKHLPNSYPLTDLVGLVETSIGKMVPIMTAEDLEKDPLQVFAEPYNTLILDRKGFLGEIPEIEEFALKDNIKAWVDRKAFIHNLGHAAAAYFGYHMLPDSRYIHEVLANEKILEFTRKVMQEAAELLRAIYTDEFSEKDIADHINDLLTRFQNPDLGDTLFRVGSDLKRKLGPDDRFMATIRLAMKKKVPYGMILEAMAHGFFFEAKDEHGHMYPGDLDFLKGVSEDLDEVLEQICGLDPSQDFHLISELKKQIEKLSHYND